MPPTRRPRLPPPYLRRRRCCLAVSLPRPPRRPRPARGCCSPHQAVKKGDCVHERERLRHERLLHLTPLRIAGRAPLYERRCVARAGTIRALSYLYVVTYLLVLVVSWPPQQPPTLGSEP